MRILDRYIGIQVIGGSILALAVLLSVFAFIDFVEDLDSVGQGTYSVLGAIEHSILTMPSRAFEMFPPAALIGTLLGLGTLAAGREIIVVRAAGVSIQRIALAVMKAGGLLVLLAVVVGELVAPPSERLAQSRRSVAVNAELTLKTSYGFWVRDKQSFINIRKLLPDDNLEDVYIYEFDDDRRMRTSTHAARASHTDEGWLLEGITQSVLRDGKVTTRELERALWNSPLLPELVQTATVRPESLSARGLLSHIAYLEDNGLATARFELALLNKFVYPLATAVMIYLAVAMVLMRATPMAVGQRVVIGALVGVGFHLLHNTSIRLGLVFELPPIFTALLPTLAFTALAVFLIRRAQ
jgi:lipopolysaccharide export system permease protein